MTKHSVATWLPILLVAACGAEMPGEPSDPRGTERRAAPAAVGPAPDLGQLVPPAHGDTVPWGFPAGENVLGNGPCAAVTLASVLGQIRAEVGDVRDIQSFRPSGPRGVMMDAGQATPAGVTPAPATEKSTYVVGFMDDRSFGAAFFRGDRCRGDRCEDRQYWYFETDEQCRPRWVGQHRAIDRPGGRYGTCVDATGSSLWHFPGNPAARQRCDADWSPRDISGTRRALSLDPTGTCSGKRGTFVPVDVTITQGADRANALVTLHGTGIAFVDGRAFPGKVERQSFAARITETTTGPCPVQRELLINLDFEAPGLNGLPGGFGVVDITEAPAGPCDTGPKGCGASLHLIHAN